MKLPYLKQWDVTPCTVRLFHGVGEDGGPELAGSWTGNVNYSEKVRRVQDRDGQWIALSGVLHIEGDILPDVQFDNGEVTIGDVTHRIVSYSRPRNPDGTVHHTRIEMA